MTTSGFAKMQNFKQMMNKNTAAAANTIPEGVVIAEREIDLIHEDPMNARRIYDSEKLKELAQSIDENGLTTPISLRDNPDKPGTYLLNNGHRRLRAIKLLKKNKIRSYIDNDFDEVQQLVDNIQHENIDPLSLAIWMAGYMKRFNVSRSDLARKLGKSPAWVTQVMAANDMKGVLLDAYNAGKIRDITTVAELVRTEKKDPEKVHALLESSDSISRSDLAILKPQQPVSAPNDPTEDRIESQDPLSEPSGGIGDEKEVESSSLGEDAGKAAKTASMKKGRNCLLVSYGKNLSTLLLDETPSSEEMAFIRTEEGLKQEVELSKLKMVRIARLDK